MVATSASTSSAQRGRRQTSENGWGATMSKRSSAAAREAERARAEAERARAEAEWAAAQPAEPADAAPAVEETETVSP